MLDYSKIFLYTTGKFKNRIIFLNITRPMQLQHPMPPVASGAITQYNVTELFEITKFGSAEEILSNVTFQECLANDYIRAFNEYGIEIDVYSNKLGTVSSYSNGDVPSWNAQTNEFIPTAINALSGISIARFDLNTDFAIIGNDSTIYIDRTNLSMYFYDTVLGFYFNPANNTPFYADPTGNYIPPDLTSIFGAINGAEKFMIYFGNAPQDGIFNTGLVNYTFEITASNPLLGPFTANNTYAIPANGLFGITQAWAPEILENGLSAVGDIINMAGTDRKRVFYPAGIYWTRYRVGVSQWSNNYNFVITPTVDQTSGITPDPLSATNGFISGAGIYGGQFTIVRENIADFLTTSGLADFTYEITAIDPAVSGFTAQHTYITNYFSVGYYNHFNAQNLFENGVDVAVPVMGGFKGISTLSAGNYWTRYKIGNSQWSNTLPFILLPYITIVF